MAMYLLIARRPLYIPYSPPTRFWHSSAGPLSCAISPYACRKEN